MVKIDRPSLPDGVVIGKEADYRGDPVFGLLAGCCHNKCYLCEEKSSSLNVEHRVAHKGDPILKYDWNNLFLSCAHCNGVKNNENFNTILDPAVTDPEDYIALSLSTDDLRKHVLVKKIADAPLVDDSVRLLDRIYNGTHTAMKRLESQNLKNSIMKEIGRFRRYLRGFGEEPEDGYSLKIKDEISRAGAFAAFKRKIVRDDPELAEALTAAGIRIKEFIT